MPERSPIRLLGAAILTLALVGDAPQQADDDPGWPREIRAGNASVVIYQPQPETFEGNLLAARAAVSVAESDEAERVFGAVWLTARVETDRDARLVQVLDVTVDRVRFPDATAEQERALASLLESEIPQWNLNISLDRLLTGLELMEERLAAANLASTPPQLMFVTDPTILVSIDGEPRLQGAGNSNLMRVINTPFTIVFSPDERAYYLQAGEDA